MIEANPEAPAEAVVVVRIDSPIGTVTLAANSTGLAHVETTRAAALAPVAGPGEAAARQHAEQAAAALREYFEGARKGFDDLTLAARGTRFQQQVWNALCEIPYGQTESYGQLAARIGQPGGARAVGLANHQNPIGIIVPCHRVIGADGSLTGFAGGLDRKQWLLGHEGALSLPLFASQAGALRHT
jgi:methylated-DNA-[protein]-cysteine S-methyltransferase